MAEYNAQEICKKLKISIYTLRNWYYWERKKISEGIIDKEYLPKPKICENTKGRPRVWDEKMLDELKYYQKGIVTGRNGVNGVYSNPYHKKTKKYQEEVSKEAWTHY